ncbi:hypothetical protein R3P38DRAFT_2769094 [Favolaschia claudopus]|uniref:Uncharacterized protein n=1 Tax=Favolaschia claudopus TaxID=2862362 RepID=A0AAW0CNL2_9AGAR
MSQTQVQDLSGRLLKTLQDLNPRRKTFASTPQGFKTSIRAATHARQGFKPHLKTRRPCKAATSRPHLAPQDLRVKALHPTSSFVPSRICVYSQQHPPTPDSSNSPSRMGRLSSSFLVAPAYDLWPSPLPFKTSVGDCPRRLNLNGSTRISSSMRQDLKLRRKICASTQPQAASQALARQGLNLKNASRASRLGALRPQAASQDSTARQGINLKTCQVALKGSARQVHKTFWISRTILSSSPFNSSLPYNTRRS